MLSKSRFLAGTQCPLRLWHQVYNPELAGELSPTRHAIFDIGHEVGRLATGLYPGGVLIEEDHLYHQEAVQTTWKWMQEGSIPAIYEGAFLFDDVRVRTDVLQRTEQGKWNLIEVKSSTSVKDTHKIDLAVQYYVLRGTGVEVDRTCLLYLNNQYVFDGHKLDLEQLFTLEDLTAEVLSLQGEIPLAVTRMKEILRSSGPPETTPSHTARSPMSASSGNIVEPRCRSSGSWDFMASHNGDWRNWRPVASRISGKFQNCFPSQRSRSASEGAWSMRRIRRPEVRERIA